MIGYVYKVFHKSNPNIVYVGSTTLTLKARFQRHCAKGAMCSIYKYINEMGADNFDIVLLKEYNVVDNHHLRAYEQLWLNNTKSINVNQALRIIKPKIYYNRDDYIKRKDYFKQKYQQNAEERRAYQRQYRLRKKEERATKNTN